jgi:YVTN family beta-propeller protein
MLRPAHWRAWAVCGLLAYSLLVLALAALQGFFARTEVAYGQTLAVFDRPTTSSPITLSADNSLLWVVNPDDDSVSVIRTDTNAVIREINVGDEPQSVAVDPNNTFAYVANAASNNVTVIRITSANPAAFVAAPDLTVGVRGSITTGAEPWNIVISPDGQRVFVANSGQDTITVINALDRSVIGSVDLGASLCNGATDAERARHFQPRGLAVSLDSNQLYVTRFLSFVRPDGVQGSDTGKEGVVCRLNINTGSTVIGGYTPAAAITLAPAVTGFTIDSNGDGTPDATSAYPNQLQSIVVRGGQAYLPNIASSPSRPLRFNVDTHAFVNRITGIGGAEADAGALNLHLGARVPEAGKPRLFFANPWAIGFTNESGAGNAYAVSAGSDLLVKLNVDAAGALSFTGGVSTTTYIDLNDPDDAATSGANAGKNPLGIAITGDGATAYVMNYVSRNVSVVDLASDSVSAVIATTDLPPASTLDEILQVGKEIFFSSRGLFDRPGGTTVSTRDRLSSEGWQNCASCHFGGLTDATVWQFGSGPRKSVPLNGTWDPSNPDDQRILNYSAIFDEVQDFEANIRNVSGPGNLPNTNPPQLDPNHGLIFGTTINDAPAAVPPLLNIANAGRPQHTVTLPGAGRPSVAALDAMKEWVRFAIRTPNGPLTTGEITAGGGASAGGASNADITAGRGIFVQAGCQTCHGGGKWTNSTKDFVSPALAADVFTEADANGATAPNPNGGQYLARFLENIDSFNLNVPGQANTIAGQPAIGAVEIDAAGRDALGLDYDGNGQGAGFNPPSLLGIYALQPYYHNGACESLACVVADEDHRRAGLRAGSGDPLNDSTARRQLVAFLESLDAQTVPATNLRIRGHDVFFDPPTVIVGSSVEVGANISLFGPRVPTFTPGPLKVTFYDGRPGEEGTTVIGEANIAGIEEDFSEVTVRVPWEVPDTTGRRRIFVTVDSTDLFTESSERDNTANRSVLVRPVPPDRTPPVVSDVRINDGAAIATATAATVTFNASDPASPSGAETSGLRSFCLVRYTFSSAQRRWVEETCANFALLPAANGDGSFTVATNLRPRAGTAYVFVWVKDAAGNISRVPGFDVISFVPGPTERVELDRNEVRVFRISLAPGQAATIVLTPSAGDIDVSVFDGVGSGATRIQVSAQNGLAPETIALSVPAGGSATTFQVEVRAVVNSAFTIAVSPTAASLAQADQIDPGKDIPTTAIVAGPPALQAAIGEAQDMNLPLLRK